MNSDSPSLPPFGAPYAPDDSVIAARLLETARLKAEQDARIDRTATRLIAAIRAHDDRLGGVEDMLREFALSTKEGLALMVLAEALLRVPDARTADQFIEDKLGQGDFVHHETKSSAFLVNASAWALGMSARVIQPGETPEGTIGRLAKRLGVPAVRAATRQAMRLMGSHFVLGETIEAALDRARPHSVRGPRYSFDMLGEGARTAADAERYFDSYASAIQTIGRAADDQRSLPDRPGISVKLSALHPRFEAVSRDRVMRELVPRLIDLARRAKTHDLNFTVDAEEADRLELSLEVIAAAFSDASLAGWDGFGLAIQAYQKRAAAVIGYTDELARALNRRMMVRLVKGAYWDTEIKRAQERGLDGYPVFTRKAMTDLNYVACAQTLLALRPRIFPQFATHNALTVATVLELAGGETGYEFQRLHGMGEALYERLSEDYPNLAYRTYAPVGSHRDLLAYLVRRLLENGANSSFVALAADDAVPVATLLRRPADIIGTADNARHPNIRLPRDLYRPQRTNSRGLEFGDRAALSELVLSIAAEATPVAAAPLINGKPATGAARRIVSPIDQQTPAGSVVDATPEQASEAIAAATEGFKAWSRTPVARRAEILQRAADLLEQRAAHFIALLQREGGKTLDDALSEVREAVDFCRYYAAEGRRLFSGETMPSPTGESNLLLLRGRGVFIAISPWNFPLAIFTGQVTAALMAGNAVVAKPAEQTPLIAAEAVRLLHEAGVPATALHMIPGDGHIGAALAAHRDVAGVVFTGSTEVARSINRALAAKDGPIVPLIAETGGINAMIVDATALPEQVADDVVMSAFRSAGQRCSALRLLFVQDDVADRMIEMIAGAARELAIGDPREVATHIGPVIDVEAKQRLDTHIARMKNEARVHFAGSAPGGNYVAPHIFELPDAGQLTEEVFGPILHVVRYRADRFDRVLQSIERSGYGLTLGIHSRIDDTIETVIDRLAVGNVYVNRNMIGAVVGVQPFGGHGLSGTGPKAGGPHYLTRFATEQTVAINTAAAGGNAALLSDGE